LEIFQLIPSCLNSWIRVWFEVNLDLVKEGMKIDDIFDISFDPIAQATPNRCAGSFLFVMPDFGSGCALGWLVLMTAEKIPVSGNGKLGPKFLVPIYPFVPRRQGWDRGYPGSQRFCLQILGHLGFFPERVEFEKKGDNCKEQKAVHWIL